MWCFHQTLLLMQQGNLWKKNRKDCKSVWGQKIQRKQCLPDTTGTMHMWTPRACDCMRRVCIRPDWGPSAEKGKWTRSHIANPEVITKWPLTKERFILSIESHWVTNHTLGQAPCPAVVKTAETKWLGVFLEILFCLLMLCVGSF